MSGPDEYDQMVARNFEPYSVQHRQLYHTIAQFLRGKPATILEIGTGIGYGLRLMLHNNCISAYLGIEPSEKCFKYINQIYDVPLMNKGFMECEIKEKFDFTVCIEVIEHIDNINLIEWFRKMLEHTKEAAFVSTPDRLTDEHGFFTKEEVQEAMYEAGFKHVVKIEWQKPHTLFIGEV